MERHHSEFGIARLPYSDRQRIVVVDDETLAAHEDPPVDSAGARGGPNILKDVFNRVRQRISPPGSPGEMTLRSVDRLRRQGIGVRPVAQSEADELLLPAGHPLTGQLYVGDPVSPDRYHLMADFHLRVFEAKFADAIDLLGNLGARRFVVRSEYWWGRKAAGKLTLPTQIGPVGLKGALRSRAARKIIFQAELEPTHVREPDDIPWLRHQVMWQKLAELRLESGLRTFDLAVENRNDHQITAELGNHVRKTSLGIGGTYEEFTSTKWVISGAFEAMPRRRIFGR